MKRLLPLLPWLLWLWLSIVIVGAFHYAPLAEGFVGESSRILFFHVPAAWVSFLAFVAAGVWSLRYLAGGRLERHDVAALAAVELGLVFGVLATVTGAIWARIMWGAYWNWDPRQTSVLIALLFYAAYLALRAAIEDPQTRRRLAASYGVLGLVVAPFLFFVLPRLGFTLHPDAVVNVRGKVEVDARMLQVLIASSVGFSVLFFWIHSMRCRIVALADRSERG
jgi:heme exporter protein C